MKLGGLNLSEFEIEIDRFYLIICVYRFRFKIDRMGSRVSESLNLNEFKILIDFIEVDYVSFDDKIMEKEFIDSDRE